MRIRTICVLLSLFWIVFVWGFWTRGIFALGFNAWIYMSALVIFLVWLLSKGERYRPGDLAWIIPLLLIALSFALYENPFFKVFALLVFPVALASAAVYAWTDEKGSRMWNFYFLMHLVSRIFSFFSHLGQSFRLLFRFGEIRASGKRETILRVITGLVVLLIALFVILPLLSSADAQFGEKLGSIVDIIRQIVSASIVPKILVLFLFSYITLTAVLAWAKPHAVGEQPEERHRDSLIWGIVLVGVLVFYAMFLWVQADRLWVGALPFDFKETENLVKSGFWQLLFLSFLNLATFFFLYRKTSPVLQKILSVFTIASLLLLASSAQRMWLYVTHYGFSYEKFYAAYAVLFCAILFVWLLTRLFAAKKSNVLRFVAFQFLWMFALVAVMPVEQIVLKSNMALVQKPDSHIQLLELRMLSSDVLDRVKTYRAEQRLDADWDAWIQEQEQRVLNKPWYERNL